jgi:Lantibiotic biosynthesis dehydratase C-term
MDDLKAAPEFFADPVLTASIYCTGLLDAALFRAVRPFWRTFQAENPDSRCFLWVMRYGRGGEHLKVRVHGPEGLRSRLREILGEKASAFLSSLPQPKLPAEKRGWGRTPAIDAEDSVMEDHPDRTVLWTTYGRSHVTMGGEPFLSDDRYAALFTRCLARSSEIVLSLEPGEDGMLPFKARHNTLLKALVAALAISDLSPEQRLDYIKYHRDWLLRFVLPKDRMAEAEPLEQLLRSFEIRVQQMGRTLRALRNSSLAEWRKTRPALLQAEDTFTAWQRALADLMDYVSPFRDDPACILDPFATDVLYGPLFKLLHSFSNQLGNNLANEALVHHVLLRTGDLSISDQERGAA